MLPRVHPPIKNRTRRSEVFRAHTTRPLTGSFGAREGARAHKRRAHVVVVVVVVVVCISLSPTHAPRLQQCVGGGKIGSSFGRDLPLNTIQCPSAAKKSSSRLPTRA